MECNQFTLQIKICVKYFQLLTSKNIPHMFDSVNRQHVKTHEIERDGVPLSFTFSLHR